MGDGPATCSTCTDLASTKPGWIFDTNGYYRDLGVSTRASRVEIRDAYLGSPQTARLTFVARQLLDPVVRRAYDATPLGSVFFDGYVLDQVRRADALRTTSGASPASTPLDTPSKVVLDTERQREQGGTRSTDWSYAFYLWGTDRADKKMLSELQERLVSALGQQKEIHQLAVGLRGGMAQPVEVTVVGRRIVVFLHEDEDLTDALVHRASGVITSLDLT